jgi:hypothetical protein
MMTDWYQKATDALQLNGLGERTQEAYVRALRMLCQFYHKTPDQISEPELQQYLPHIARTATAGRPVPCASAIAAFASSSSMCSGATGIP